MDLEPHFAHSVSAGSLLEVGHDRPIDLGLPEAWFLADGQLNVFYEPTDGERPLGHRRHLFRLDAGRLLLGTGGGRPGVKLVAVGADATQVVRLGRDELARLAGSPGGAGSLAALVDEWVATLYGRIAAELPPEDCEEIEPGEYLAAGRAVRVRAQEGIVWVRHRTGSSRLLGEGGAAVNGHAATPLCHHAWLEVAAESVLEVHSTATLLAVGELWESMDRLHDLLLDFVQRSLEDENRGERERLQRRVDSDAAIFAGAFERVAEALTRRSSPPGDLLAADPDPLVEAARLVAAALRLPVAAPVEGSSAAADDPLAAFTRASQLRTRQVLLREGWWRGEAGPLLGFRHHDATPVALLPQRGRGYTVVDPVTGVRTALTPQAAELLEPKAYSFYRSFPQRPMRLFDVIRFGLQGCGRDLAMVVGIGVVGALLSLVPPMAMRKIFNDLVPGAARGELLQVTLVLFVVALAAALLSVSGAIAMVRLESRSATTVQAAVWDRLLSLPMSFFRPYTAGDLASRVMSIESMRQVISGQVVGVLLAGIFSLFHFILLYWYSARLALWASTIVGVALLATLVAGRFQIAAERQVVAVRDRLAGSVLQFLSSIAKLRVSGAEVRALAVWAEGFSRQRRHQFLSRTVGNALLSFHAGLPLLASVVIYGAALSLMARTGELRTGDFLAFTASFSFCLVHLLGAGSAVVRAAAALPLYRQAEPVLHALPEVDPAKADPGRLHGHLAVHRVSFRYRPDGPLVLRDVSIEARPGEFIALVGPSGSGKSTLLRLLLGFETPESGTICYDGNELARLDPRAVRLQIGVVLQNGRLMSGDLLTNIVGSTRATLDDAWEAARMAGLDRDVQAMPMGMHTYLGEGAGTLSGGQRQRLMIARALVRKPRILLFDEATSALDNRTQAIVTESLDSLQATRIVVAHRLSTILHADRIFVFDQGEVVENGTHDELLARNGLFAGLARRQMV